MEFFRAKFHLEFFRKIEYFDLDHSGNGMIAAAFKSANMLGTNRHEITSHPISVTKRRHT